MTQPSWQKLPAARPALSERDLRRWTLGLGAGLLGLGLLIFALTGGDVLRRSTRGTHRVTFPGSRTVKLTPGVYYAVPARRGPRPRLMNVTVQGALTGLPAAVRMFIDGPGPSGRPFFEAEILDAGDYLVTGVLGGDAALPVEILLMHHSLAGNRSDVVAGAVVGFLLCAGGGALLWTARRRAASLSGTFSGPQRFKT